MKLIVEGTAEEISALALAAQGRRNEFKFSDDIAGLVKIIASDLQAKGGTEPEAPTKPSS